MKRREHAMISALRRREGLTLLEVMVVVLILGLIAGIVGVVVRGQLERARVRVARIQMQELKDALEFFYQDNNFYPSTQQGLRALVTPPEDERVRDWPEGGYLEAVPRDPWGNEYEYISPGAHGDYDIICYGRDGMEGGEGADADIKSWELHAQNSGG